MDDINQQSKIIKISYKKLYKQKCKDLEVEEKKINELHEKIKFLEEENKKLNLSISNSNTAKNGYKEEDKICDYLNFDENIRKKVNEFISGIYDNCIKLKGNSKVDIMSENKIILAQIKKYKKEQFQQLDRHYVNDLIKFIPELNEYEEILKNWCELPLKDDGKYIDKNRILLSNKNYTEQMLSDFINILNKNKRIILEYAFYGINQLDKPIYLIGIEYIKNVRSKLIIYKISDIINYLLLQKFTITKSKSVIALGNSLTLQRKGGDGGKKSSNQLQFKIIISKLNINEYIEHEL